MSHVNSPRHILVASCLIHNEADEILLVNHHKRGWELPQGRIENGETVTEALHREVFEETGVNITNARLATLWSKVSEPTAAIFCFCADYLSGNLTASKETPELGWFSEPEARALVTHPVNHDRLKVLLANRDELILKSYRTGPYQLLS